MARPRKIYKPKKPHKPYFSYRVKEKDGRWGTWTGFFNNLEDAVKWYRKYGFEFEKRGYELALFMNNLIIVSPPLEDSLVGCEGTRVIGYLKEIYHKKYSEYQKDYMEYLENYKRYKLLKNGKTKRKGPGVVAEKSQDQRS